MTPYEALYGRRCRTPLCWNQDGESLVLGPEFLQQTSEKVRAIQERMRATQSIGRAIKSRNLTPRFVGPYQILRRIGAAAYEIALPPHLANLHNVFHVSQLRKYIADPSHVLESDDIQIREDLTVNTGPVRILNSQVKKLRGKEIRTVKVLWDESTQEMT
ncbi:uncharacterized protein LOC114170326 [Vigna unguiculata]|uniref:uncharacterized protein LOC114170326 n=1 Tax=Vigna unguiculata TaxID=3917 RepID=UPI0010167BA9|nr:uncharacterized protein LOC114170326 [Vigna unguiculata]